MRAKTNTLTIQTPEGVRFSFILAGPVIRFLAWLLDVACIVLLSRLLGGILGVLGLISQDLAQAVTILAYFIISIGYSLAFEWYWRGQTVGKRLLGLRVMDEQALNLRFSQIAIRNLLRAVDGLPGLYLLGGLAMLVSSRSQRLGDLAACTVVVRHIRAGPPDLDLLLNDKYNSFLSYPHLAARLRQRVGSAATNLLWKAMWRREELDPQARIGLYQELTNYFKSLVSWPPEAELGLSDEQYLRNILGVLYNLSDHGQVNGSGGARQKEVPS